jgi:hypothetical protein
MLPLSATGEQLSTKATDIASRTQRLSSSIAELAA